MFSFCVIRSHRGETAFFFPVFAVYISAGDAVNTTHRSEQHFPAQSMTLWGVLGVLFYCCHSGGGRHLPVGLLKANVKAKSGLWAGATFPASTWAQTCSNNLSHGVFTFPPAEILQSMEGAVWP